MKCKKMIKLISTVLVAVTVLTGLSLSIPQEASAQSMYELFCNNNSSNIGGELTKVKNRLKSYDRIVFTDVDMSCVNIKMEYYINDVLVTTKSPSAISEDSCYISMPMIHYNDVDYDSWVCYKSVESKKDGITSIVIKMASNQYILGKYTDYFREVNNEIQELLKKSLPGDSIVIDVGNLSSLKQQTMQEIANHREVTVTLICSGVDSPYMIKIEPEDKIPTDVEYAGFGGYLAGLFGRETIDIALVEGANQLVDLTTETTLKDANTKLINIIKTAPLNATLIVNATNITCFTPETVEALSKREDLKVRVFYMVGDKEYYTNMKTGTALLNDLGKKADYAGFSGFLAGKYGKTLYTE